MGIGLPKMPLAGDATGSRLLELDRPDAEGFVLFSWRC